MKLEYLNEVSSDSGRPSPKLTDEKWQEYFKLLKGTITPSTEKRMRVSKGSAWVNKHYATDDYDTTDPLWVRYRGYINDVLKNIRAGGIDFVYYTYQIADLLRYEHDTLVTRYDKEGYFVVYLEK